MYWHQALNLRVRCGTPAFTRTGQESGATRESFGALRTQMFESDTLHHKHANCSLCESLQIFHNNAEKQVWPVEDVFSCHTIFYTALQGKCMRSFLCKKNYLSTIDVLVAWKNGYAVALQKSF